MADIDHNLCVGCQSVIPLRHSGKGWVRFCPQCLRNFRQAFAGALGRLPLALKGQTPEQCSERLKRWWARLSFEEKSAISKERARLISADVRRKNGFAGGAVRGSQLLALSYEERVRMSANGRRAFEERRRAARQAVAESGLKTCLTCRCTMPVHCFSPNKGSLVARPNCKACTSIRVHHGRFPVVRKRDGTLIVPASWRGFQSGGAKEIFERCWGPWGLLALPEKQAA